MESTSARSVVFFLFILASYGNVHLQPSNFDTKDVVNDMDNNSVATIDQSFASNIRHTERIAGGSYADEGQFPFMAVVHRLIDGRRVTQCGGTIISRRWVLTAGHCVIRFPQRFFVIFGIIDKTGIGYSVNRGPGIAMMTTRAFVPPDYFYNNNDIGLLRMPRDIPFSETIQPIRLAGLREDRIPTDEVAVVVGWGRDESRNTGTTRLKYAVMPLISKHECSVFWRVDHRNICTVPGLGRSACQGDSGGPLFIMRHNRPLQIGIVSYGDANCPSSRPGVYTRVAAFERWIHHVTGLRL